MVLHSRRRDPFSPNARFFSNENYGIVKGDATAAILSDGGYRSYNAGKLARNFLNSCLLFHLWSEQDFGLSSCVFVRYHVPCGLAYFWQCSSIPVLLKRTITRISYRTRPDHCQLSFCDPPERERQRASSKVRRGCCCTAHHGRRRRGGSLRSTPLLFSFCRNLILPLLCLQERRSKGFRLRVPFPHRCGWCGPFISVG